jgi:hypothetical protein
MRKTAFTFGLLLSLATPSARADLSTLAKPYFLGTKPGAWAKYEQTTTDPKGKTSVLEMTVARLENEGQSIWFEVRIDPKTGSKQKAQTTRYLLNPAFKPEKNPLNFVNYIERVITQEDGRKAVEMPWAMFRPLVQSLVGFVDYGANLTAKGTETIDGKACDRYGLSGRYEFKILFMTLKGTYESDLWLSDAVPFGRVKEVDVVKDDKGNITKTDWKLLGTGSGYASKITGPIEKSEPPPKLPFGG